MHTLEAMLATVQSKSAAFWFSEEPEPEVRT